MGRLDRLAEELRVLTENLQAAAKVQQALRAGEELPPAPPRRPQTPVLVLRTMPPAHKKKAPGP